MKRDWDTIREILGKVESCTLPTDQVRLGNFDGTRAAEVSYHMALLIEAGLVNGQMVRTIGPEAKDFIASRLTWQGHEFLDSIRSESVWQKTKKTISEHGVTMTFDLVKEVAREAASALIKSAIGGK